MDIKKYIYGHCVSPVKVRIWDSFSNSYVVRLLPCGKCLHCRNTHINEWCTRLVAQKKYSKYCYYVSLDYAPFSLSDPNAYKLASETAACYHNINKNGTFGMHPLVLCKNHLQDFYKRLRKQGIKCQYFACGEYGMHANGRGYGRPHFHNIIFSNSPITDSSFEKAWTINGYKIGRVDIQDMSMFQLGDKNSLKIFKYVCKYLQKGDFDFEKLATIDFHRTYFKSIKLAIKPKTELFSGDSFQIIGDEGFTWREYIKKYSPFVVCSRRPSIGSDYFKDNLERFTRKDFRLFGLPDSCTSFPRYYVRRAKESAYPVFCIGSVSQKPSSSSRMGYILQILTQLYNNRLFIENWSPTPQKSWCINKQKGGALSLCINDENISLSELSFYDSLNKFMYVFDGYGYKVWAKMRDYSFSLVDYMDIYDVLKEFYPSWDRFRKVFIEPAEYNRVLIEKELQDSINAYYKPFDDRSSYDLFLQDVYNIYQQELSGLYKTKLLMQNSKQLL